MREDTSILQVPAIKALSTSQKISQDYYVLVQTLSDRSRLWKSVCQVGSV